jgi:hypothetical protein
MDWNTWIDLLLGGGCLTGLIGMLTLRSTVTKAKAEAEKARAEAERARAEAERVRIDNTAEATRILMENIVKPLTNELNETREVVAALRREVARLRKAMAAANGCPHAGSCVVLERLREWQERQDNTEQPEPPECERQQLPQARSDPQGAPCGGHGGAANCRGQP